MATASVSLAAVSDRELEQEFKRLQDERSTVTAKLESDRAKRTAAHFERGRLVDAVAAGKAKESEVRRQEEELSSIAIRIEGYEKLLQAKTERIDLVEKELVGRRAIADKAARAKELEALHLKGVQARDRMLANMRRLIAEDFVAFNAVRDEIHARFNDAAGQEVFLKLTNGMHNPDGSPKFALDMVLTEGWKKRGDIIFTLASLTPPAKN